MTRKTKICIIIMYILGCIGGLYLTTVLPYEVNMTQYIGELLIGGIFTGLVVTEKISIN